METRDDFDGDEWLNDVAIKELEFYRSQTLQNQALVFYSAITVFLTSSMTPLFTATLAHTPATFNTEFFGNIIVGAFLFSLALIWGLVLLQAYHGGSKNLDRPSIAFELKRIGGTEVVAAGHAAPDGSISMHDQAMVNFNDICLSQILSYRNALIWRRRIQKSTIYSFAFCISVFAFSMRYFALMSLHK
jgi:hypothetical protein